MDYSKFTSPLDPTVKLKAKEGEALTYPTYYRNLMGKLNFLTNTILNIVYSVQHLSQFMDDPIEPHLKVAFHLLRYLKGDLTLGYSCLGIQIILSGRTVILIGQYA